MISWMLTASQYIPGLAMTHCQPAVEVKVLCRPLLKARVDEQRRQQQVLHPEHPAPVLLEPKIRLFVEGTEVKPEDHLFIRALEESGCINKEIDIKEIEGKDEGGRSVVLGWCAFTYQVSSTQSFLHMSAVHSTSLQHITPFHRALTV